MCVKKNRIRVLPWFGLLFLTACVTINIYFPAAAAEQVADEIIKGIQSENVPSAPVPTPDVLKPQSNSKLGGYAWVDGVFNLLVAPAYAGDANLSVDSAEIRQLTGAMQARFNSLSGYYERGLIAIKADGFLVVRGSVPLQERNTVNKLIASENSDRQRLYQAIANANGHPEWTAQIQATFASRWIGNAQAGWWYQLNNGSWTQK